MLQERQQTNWKQPSQDLREQGQGSTQQQSLQHHQRGSWNASSRGIYQEQIEQNRGALRQQQMMRWQQKQGPQQE